MTQTEKQALAFLHDCALDKNRLLNETEQVILQTIQYTLRQADEIIICLGGKAGRLGECVVGTALLEATLYTLHYIGKDNVPVHVFVDEAVASLFGTKLYHANLHFHPSKEADDIQICVNYIGRDKNGIILDFHGAHDNMPYFQLTKNPSVQETQTQPDKHSYIAILGHLFRVGVRSYAVRGPERRYADFIETLFALPAGTIDQKQAQPHLLLSDTEKHIRYHQLAQAFDLDLTSSSIVCFFQSVVPAKCYERWDEVLQLLCARLASYAPGQKINIVLACGPDADLPQGIRKADIEEWLGDFHGVAENAHTVICSTSSLRDLAILTSHAKIVLSNDTGPGHIAGALGIPTITPFLPGTIYSKQVWSSTLYHHGVTLDPNPYSFRELEAAVLWSKTDIINSIEPQALCAMAWPYLQKSVTRTG
jgi:Glycosyltransferase family 9 (heptosyltransferase)